jgi:integrase
VIASMPRPRPPRLHRETNRHGNAVWYVRVGKGSRTRLRAPYGTPEFEAQYQAALSGKPLDSRRDKPASGTLAWLWDQYRQSAAWTQKLKPATWRMHERIMKKVLETSGKEPFTSINRKSIVAGREKRSPTPSQARKFLDTMRGLFRWALDAEHIKIDPTAGVENPLKPKNNGFPTWTEEDVEAYHRRWPIGTRQRVWLDVLLYTGLRRSDAVRIGKQHVKNGIATLYTVKGGETIEVTLPILAVLQRTLDQGPTGDLAWVCGDKGGPFVVESFGNAFSEAARSAGVKKSAHGVRKIAATTAANNGATVAQLEAIFGWQGGRMASLYTKAADRRRLALEAMSKLDGERTSIPAPEEKVRAPSEKSE